MGILTPNFGLDKPAVGEVGWGALVNANWDIIDANLVNAIPRSYLAGLILSNNTGSPNTKIDISPGVAQDVSNAGAMNFTTIFTKDISAPWAVGNGGGGLGPGLSLSPNQWYHLFIMKRTDTNVIDAFYDTILTATHIPIPYTLFRRLGSVHTDGSSHIQAFIQDGNYFRMLAATSGEVNATNPGTSAVLATLNGVPGGLPVIAHVSAILNNATTNSIAVLLTDPALNDVVPTGFQCSFQASAAAATSNAGGEFDVRTNNNQQIRYRLSASGASDVLQITTKGYWDSRGRDA